MSQNVSFFRYYLCIEVFENTNTMRTITSQMNFSSKNSKEKNYEIDIYINKK